jgi:hypothetical protein
MRWLKNRWLWTGIVGISALAIAVSFFRDSDDRASLAFSDVIELARSGNVESIDVRGDELTVRTTDGATYQSRVSDGAEVVAALQSAAVNVGGQDGVVVTYADPPAFENWIAVGINLFFIAVLGVAVYLAVRLAIRRARRDGPSEGGVSG